MKNVFIAAGGLAAVAVILHLVDKNKDLKKHIDFDHLKLKFTTEELNYAYSMLLQDEQEQVKAMWETNDKFLHQVKSA